MSFDIPPSGLADFITSLAARHGVSYVETPLDALAKVITNLSDDDVEDDPIRHLLLALLRAGIIDKVVWMDLLHAYLKESHDPLPRL